MSPKPPLGSSYRPDIDGLRSIAVLLVLVFHFNLVGIGKAGFIGVDVFFVISGFLISSLIWSQLEKGRFALSTFYLRRFRRLAPAFICVQLLLLACAYFLFLPNDVADLIKQTVFAQTYLINFYLWKSVNYFGLQAENISLLHCWSLAVEEQFYLTYPLLLIGVHRYARRYFPVFLVAIAAASFALNVALVGKHAGAAFYLLPARAWELALGALLSFAQEWFRRHEWPRHVAALLGTAAIAAGVALYTPLVAFPGYFALYPTLGAAALILAGTGTGSWLSPILSCRPMVYIGRVSYSLYLIHWPVRILIESSIPEYTVGWRWFSFLVSLAMTSVLFHLVEDPVRKGTVFASGRRFVAAYAVGVTAVMVVAFSAYRTGGWRFRFPAEAVHMADYEKDQNEAGRHCEYAGAAWEKQLPTCRLGAPNAKPEWFLLGDSHAWALAPAFSQFLDSRNQGGQTIFIHACMPVLGLGNDQCKAFASNTIGHIIRDPEISTVVLASIWRQEFEGDFLVGPGNIPFKGDERAVVFKQQFAETVRRLADAGKRVIVWEAIPTAKQSVPKALAWERISHRSIDIATTRRDHEQLFRFLSEAILEARPMIWATVSPAAAMCQSGGCVLEDNGIPLYFDNNHPSLSGSPYFARILSSQLGGRLDAPR
jgi:peptidoglycan/LPS O-acetylase OafA/YrhL